MLNFVNLSQMIAGFGFSYMSRLNKLARKGSTKRGYALLEKLAHAHYRAYMKAPFEFPKF